MKDENLKPNPNTLLKGIAIQQVGFAVVSTTIIAA